jgi:hypothetical protein
MDKSNRLGTVPGNENLPRTFGSVDERGESRRTSGHVSTRNCGSCRRSNATGKPRYWRKSIIGAGILLYGATSNRL